VGDVGSTERCPCCRRGPVKQLDKELSPWWAERYGDQQLYRCRNCRTVFVAHDARLVSIRRCHDCTEWFIPYQGNQLYCCDDHKERHYKALMRERGQQLKSVREEKQRGQTQEEGQATPPSAGATA